MSPDNYTTADIDNPEHMDHIRQRVGMYLSADEPKMVAFREIFDNAFDEVVGGHATTVEIIFHEDGSFTITDNGRGLPVDSDNKKKINGIILTVGTPNSGGKFKDTDVVSAGTNGVGASATNAVSKRFDVTVYKSGKVYHQNFRCGKPGKWGGEGFDPNANFTPGSGQLRGTKAPAGKRGTAIRFFFDEDILSDTRFDVDELLFRAKSTAMLIEGATLRITHADGQTEVITGGTGTSGVLSDASGVEAAGTLTGSTEYTEARKKKYLHWGVSFTPHTPSSSFGFVNNVYTASGGSHVTSTQKVFGEVMAEKAKRVRGLGLKKGEDPPAADDFVATVAMVVEVRTPHARLDGQQKRSLGSKPLYNALAADLGESFTTWVERRENAATVNDWVMAARNRAREVRSAELAKQRVRTPVRSVGENLSLPVKLRPCRTNRAGGAELFIAEGDSALSTIEAARDAEYQAAVPIRGKMVNTYGMSIEAIMKNKEIAELTKVIGGGIGRNFSVEDVRYEKIFMATDADVDGFHISILGLTMFHTLMPGLIEAGMVWRLNPPLFVIKPYDGSPNGFVQDRKQLEIELKKLGSKRNKVEIQRCKGLGEMDENDFWDSVMNPETRSIQQVTIQDVEKTEAMMETLFGKNTEVRRQWIAQTRGNFDIEEMDL